MKGLKNGTKADNVSVFVPILRKLGHNQDRSDRLALLSRQFDGCPDIRMKSRYQGP